MMITPAGRQTEREREREWCRYPPVVSVQMVVGVCELIIAETEVNQL